MKILFLYNNDNALPLAEWLSLDGNEVTLYKNEISNSFPGLGDFDLILSFSYRYIIPTSVLERVNWNAVNLHISYLPWNRGANPNQWSIIDNTPKGVTLHYTAEKLDAGDIISQKLVHFSQDDTLSSSYQKLIQAAMELFKETFEEYHHWQDMRKTPVFYGSYHSNADYIPYRQLLGDNYNITIQEFIRIVGAMQNENGDI